MGEVPFYIGGFSHDHQFFQMENLFLVPIISGKVGLFKQN
ncbi:hypothetical protein MWLf4_0954 [Limosilactobacillus fermentum]|nr:hypothetical protein MWLf4_0954 [Limosilactobacillus fermentum]